VKYISLLTLPYFENCDLISVRAYLYTICVYSNILSTTTSCRVDPLWRVHDSCYASLDNQLYIVEWCY